MTELETRIRRGLAEYVDATPVADPPPLLTPGHRPRPVRRSMVRLLGPVLVAAATVVVLFAAIPVVVPDSGDRPSAPAPVASIPLEFAGYSALTGTVEGSPPGRAVAVYRYTNDNIPWPDQVIALSADADRYRTLAETRTSWLGKEPAPFLLSADGTRVAVGSGPRAMSEIPVVDLRTGQVARYAVEANSTVTLLAWSADGRRLAYATRPFRPMPEFYGESLRAAGGQLWLLDLETGRSTVPRSSALPPSVAYAAFSPDGTLLAVQAGGPDNGAEERQSAPGEPIIIRLSDGVVVASPAAPPQYHLANQAAWSPDAQRLAMVAESDAALIAPPVGQSGAWQPGPQMADGGFFLGWQAPDRIVVRTSEIVAMDLDGGAPIVLSRGDATLADDVNLVDLQLAYGLLPELRTRPPGEVDRGPWPTWLRVAAAGGAVLVLLPFALLARALRRRRPPPIRPAGEVLIGSGLDVDEGRVTAVAWDTVSQSEATVRRATDAPVSGHIPIGTRARAQLTMTVDGRTVRLLPGRGRLTRGSYRVTAVDGGVIYHLRPCSASTSRLIRDGRRIGELTRSQPTEITARWNREVAVTSTDAAIGYALAAAFGTGARFFLVALVEDGLDGFPI